MPTTRLESLLDAELEEKATAGTIKGAENVVRAVLPPRDGKGPRFLLEGHRDKSFLRMNSNSYLGLSFNADLARAEEQADRELGTGPGAVRFISGTWAPHVELERRLATFHQREAAIIFSSAYATMMGCLPQLVTRETVVISDELNHNCIINSIRLAGQGDKRIYRHLDMAELEYHLDDARHTAQRAIIVTDGIFSMRGDNAPLDEISELADKYDADFAENVIVIVDDSHGVGAFGRTGRGTEEFTGAAPADLLIGTLGKAFGVNGGYVAASNTIVSHLRETSPFYIYSNPITPGEAAAALKAVEWVDSDKGFALLAHLLQMTRHFEDGLRELGFETIPGEHPIVPLMVRDTSRTAALAMHLFDEGILATGLNYPVVPRGDEEIRFQISADHTVQDVEEVLHVLRRFGGRTPPASAPMLQG
ncbi:MAG: aminotransferase class I/II-fold pyridoxal phosphate-dependent enzyme [Rhodobacteraceae bacterium]|nr:aminotransferase class I/II-fold pyridoxal phosphate-dependent enzyme [Paracoccaceae bacterium]